MNQLLNFDMLKPWWWLLAHGPEKLLDPGIMR